MNEKGFAVTSLLYGAIALILILSVVVISVMTTNRSLNTDFVDTVERELSSSIESFNEKIDPQAPELVGEMIPVIYNGTNWEKADINNINGSWYNYEEQRWANVVTVSNNRTSYMSSDVGTTINMTDIEAMFVWIPRYSYTIYKKGSEVGMSGYGGVSPSSVSTPGAINIKWVDDTVVDTGKAFYSEGTVTNWYTPPAFCWGNTCDDPDTRSSSTELNGIWVGKFETGVKDEEANEVLNCVNTPDATNCNRVMQPIIKPGVTSWRFASISTAFNSVKSYMNGVSGSSKYGFNTHPDFPNSYDAHVIKSTEWAAVAYLSQSRYGKYGNESYTGVNKEIYQNKNEYYITGDSNGTPPQTTVLSQCGYNDLNDRGNGKGSCGGGASTTGNIYGVYDMAGGTWEHVMGNMQTSSGGMNYATSGFSSPLEAKYYNSYKTGNAYNDYSRYIKGDATYETLGFYGDHKNLVVLPNCWMLRGGVISYGNEAEAGVFSFGGTVGGPYYYGFRISLVPNH